MPVPRLHIMKNILYFVVFILAFMFVKSSFGLIAACLLTLVVIAALLYTRRALLYTQMANNAYFIKGNKKKAQRLYEKAYKTLDMTSQCKISYSSFCLRENMYERGKRLLNEVINSRRSTQEEKIGAKHNMAVLMWREGNLDGAIVLLEQLHKEAPATNTYGTLGVLYLEKAKKLQNPQEYLPFMKEAYEYNDGDKTICDNLGELYYIMGDYENAKEVYEKLVKLTFQTPMPYYNYARVLKALGDADGAREYFNKALDGRFTGVMTITPDDVKRELEALGK